MKLKNDKEINKEKWDVFLRENKFSSPFQTPEFYDFFNTVKGFSADVFSVEDEDKIQALVVVTIQKEKGLKSFFSKRAIIYGGILFETEEALKFLLKKIIDYYKGKLIYIEIRNYKDYSSFLPIFQVCDWKYMPWLNYQLPIETELQVENLMSSGRWNQIQKAKKQGVTYAEAQSEDEVKAFYKILSDLYAHKIKKPLFPVEFFLNFYQQNLGKYLLVRYDNKIIGGIMCPILGDKIIYEFYVCGLDNEYKECYPSVMATWAAIDFALKNQIKLFDFMGAGSPESSYGVREFKARFGGNLVETGRFIKILNKPMYFIGKLGMKILKII